jgi:hypothetical protein
VSERRALVDSLTCVNSRLKVTHVTKTQVYLPEEDLEALHAISERTGRSLADLIRQAIRDTWLRPEAKGPVGLWAGPVRQTSVSHDSIYDEP